ncbi:MAG: hypothetical protein AAB370_07625 [Verrucomicrobiota bacterium]
MTQASLSNRLPDGKVRGFWIAPPQAMWRTPLICLLAPGLLLVTLEWFSLSRWGIKLLSNSLWPIFSVLAFAAFVGIVVCPFLLLSKRRRRNALLGLLSSVAFLSSFIVGASVEQRIRHDAFLNLVERSTPLIQAIQAYEKKHGLPPVSLAALVPEFLSAVPGTEIGAYPEYKYVTGEKAKRFENNPWALYIFTPSGGINFDQFLYFPLQNYPERGFGGWLERIGDWAYVHE